MNNIENNAIKLFDSLYGREFISRTKKLREECLELIEAIDNMGHYPKDGHLDHLIDEMSDVEAVLTHTSNILNISRIELLNMAVYKSERRKTEPNFKRQ